jgi:BON domain
MNGGNSSATTILPNRETMRLVCSLPSQGAIAEFSRSPGANPAGWRLLLFGIFLALASASRAADTRDWVPVGPPPEDATAHDLELTLRAREALLRDPQLQQARLGVSVFHRRATLWGDVPTAEVGERAHRCLQRIIGLQEIRDEWHVAGPEPAGDRMAGPLQERVDAADPPFSQPRRIRGALVGRPEADNRAPGRDLLWHPLDNRRRRPAGAQEAAAPAPATDGQSPNGETVLWLPKLRQELGWRPGLVSPLPTRASRATEDADPVALPAIRLTHPADGQPATVVDPLPSVPAQRERNPVSTSSPLAANLIQEQIERLRRSDARFAGLRVDLKEGIVSLSGVASHWEHVYDLARSIARLPGVQRVILKDVQAGH